MYLRVFNFIERLPDFDALSGSVRGTILIGHFVMLLLIFVVQLSCSGSQTVETWELDCLPDFELMSEDDFELVEPGSLGVNRRLIPCPVHKSIQAGSSWNSLHVDGDRIYASWYLQNHDLVVSENEGGESAYEGVSVTYLVLSRSFDGGETFEPLTLVDKVGETTSNEDFRRYITVLAHDSEVLILSRYHSYKPYVYSSADGGASFAPQYFAETYPPEGYPPEGVPYIEDFLRWKFDNQHNLVCYKRIGVVVESGSEQPHIVRGIWDRQDFHLIDGDYVFSTGDGYNDVTLPDFAFNSRGDEYSVFIANPDEGGRARLLLVRKLATEDEFQVLSNDLLGELPPEANWAFFLERPRIAIDLRDRIHLFLQTIEGGRLDLPRNVYLRLDGDGVIKQWLNLSDTDNLTDFGSCRIAVHGDTVAALYGALYQGNPYNRGLGPTMGLFVWNSHDGGDTFASEPVRVNDIYYESAYPSPGVYQIGFGTDGKLHLIWEDLRFDLPLASEYPDYPYYDLFDDYFPEMYYAGGYLPE
jgi:hypothetical protein